MDIFYFIMKKDGTFEDSLYYGNNYVLMETNYGYNGTIPKSMELWIYSWKKFGTIKKIMVLYQIPWYDWKPYLAIINYTKVYYRSLLLGNGAWNSRQTGELHFFLMKEIVRGNSRKCVYMILNRVIRGYNRFCYVMNCIVCYWISKLWYDTICVCYAMVYVVRITIARL